MTAAEQLEDRLYIDYQKGNIDKYQYEQRSVLIDQLKRLESVCKDFLELWPLSGYELEAYCGSTFIPAIRELLKKEKVK